jgi:branched-chain amino acid transport system ATP-binding protein
MARTLIEARGLRIEFGGVKAADGIDLDVREHEHLAIIGPNGAGKTTFLNICTGYLRPNAGTVHFGGADITGYTPRSITRLGIARAFQIPQLFLEHTVIENMLIAAAARERSWSLWRAMRNLPMREEMMELLDLVGVAHVARQVVTALPEGQRKLIDIALALALKPQVLLMDEPTSGVSSEEKFSVMDTLLGALQARQVTSVFVEHDMEMVERYADRVAVWASGQIRMQGKPSEVLANEDVKREVIGV